MSISINTSTAHAKCQQQPRSFWARLHIALTVNRQRRQLLTLDDHVLADIGLTRNEAEAEAREPMWNVPNHWRK